MIQADELQSEYTLREAKARLSEILDLVAAGVPVEITRQGAKRGRFKIIPVDPDFRSRMPGALKGRISIPANFDDEDPDILDEFERGL